MRKIKFQNEYYYSRNNRDKHVYNRGVDKREVFIDKKNFIRFLRSIKEFNGIKPIENLYRQDQMRRQEKESGTLRQLCCRSVPDSSGR